MERWKSFWTTPEIFVSAVAGACLIVKVWILRRYLGAEVDVLELMIPLGLLVPHQVLLRVRSAEKVRPKMPAWMAANGTWAAVVVVATLLSFLRWVG